MVWKSYFSIIFFLDFANRLGLWAPGCWGEVSVCSGSASVCFGSAYVASFPSSDSSALISQVEREGCLYIYIQKSIMEA